MKSSKPKEETVKYKSAVLIENKNIFYQKNNGALLQTRNGKASPKPNCTKFHTLLWFSDIISMNLSVKILLSAKD